MRRSTARRLDGLAANRGIRPRPDARPEARRLQRLASTALRRIRDNVQPLSLQMANLQGSAIIVLCSLRAEVVWQH